MNIIIKKSLTLMMSTALVIVLISSLFNISEVFAIDEQTPGSVAQIGSKYYTSLDDAVADASAGDTIKLVDNVDLTSKYASMEYHVYNLDNCTLDLAGHSIKVNDAGVVYQGDNMTIKNGTFIANNNGRYAMHVGDERETSNVVIDDVICNGGINVYNTKNTVVKSTNLTKVTGTSFYAVWADEKAEVIVEGGQFTSAGNYILNNAGTGYEASTIIKGGTYTANGATKVLDSASNTLIMGGTFSESPTLTSVSVKSTSGYNVVDNGNGTWSVVKIVKLSGVPNINNTGSSKDESTIGTLSAVDNSNETAAFTTTEKQFVKSPKTGADSNMTAFAIIGIVAMLGIAIALLAKEAYNAMK